MGPLPLTKRFCPATVPLTHVAWLEHRGMVLHGVSIGLGFSLLSLSFVAIAIGLHMTNVESNVVGMPHTGIAVAGRVRDVAAAAPILFRRILWCARDDFRP